HAAIALAVQDEFPSSYHVVCCRHLMMNLSLKRDITKALFWRICKAYTTEEFSRSISHLQDIQTDTYEKLCEVGPQRWSRAHCLLVRYNYLTSNSVEFVNACTVVYRKLPVLKLAETYRAMVQEWYYQRRKLTGTCQCRKWQLSRIPRGHVISVTRKISRRFTTFYYTLPPNNAFLGLKQFKNDYDTNVMYDIARVAGKIQLFVSHHQIDLSTVLIPNDGSLEEALE
nr:transposase, MuDR, MULE transposase domain protein [Tanacetum cinerariifolium]